MLSAMKEYDLLSTTMQDRWMTLQEVAEFLQLSKDQIYRLAQSGKIPASKLQAETRADPYSELLWSVPTASGPTTGERQLSPRTQLER